MATTQRDSKGSALTWVEMDANWDIVDTVVTGLAAHIADSADAHAASAITNTAAGNIVATTVQAAINELDTEKAALTGAAFTGDVSVAVGSGFRVGTYGGMTINGGLVVSDVAINRDTYAIDESHSSSNTAAISGVRYFAKSRGTAAVPLIVQDGDTLGALYAVGYDGTDYAMSSAITYEVDGTPGNNDMPGRIIFLTSTDGAQTPTERMRINAAGDVRISGLTASRALVTDADKDLTSSATTATEIGYVSGVTSAIQTQINTKAPTASPTFTGTITTPLTASRAVATGASSELAASATTSTELGYVSGVTSAIQTQINNITGRASGMRNRIINGAMRIDQRNAGASVAVSSVYHTDRWLGAKSGTGTATLQQLTTTPPEGFTHYLRWTVTAADTAAAAEYYFIRQAIEGNNVADLDWGLSTAQSVTLSFKVRSSLTGTFGGAVYNSASNRSYRFSYTISSANTWESKTVTIAGDTTGTWLTTNGVGVYVLFDMGSGSDFQDTAGAWTATGDWAVTGQTAVMATNSATFDITGVQFETGSSATPYEQRQYGQELELCQRYYTFVGGTATGWAFTGYQAAGTGSQQMIQFPVEMRASPTKTVVGTWGATNCGQPSLSGDSPKAAINTVVATALGQFVSSTNGVDDMFTFSAEI